MVCECGHTGNKYLVTIEVCPECEPDRVNALELTDQDCLFLRWDLEDSLWVSNSIKQELHYTSALTIARLGNILGFWFEKDIKDKVLLLSIYKI